MAVAGVRCGTTYELELSPSGVLIFRCEREPGHGGESHEGGTLDPSQSLARASWPVTADRPAPPVEPAPCLSRYDLGSAGIIGCDHEIVGHRQHVNVAFDKKWTDDDKRCLIAFGPINDERSVEPSTTADDPGSLPSGRFAYDLRGAMERHAGGFTFRGKTDTEIRRLVGELIQVGETVQCHYEADSDQVWHEVRELRAAVAARDAELAKLREAVKRVKDLACARIQEENEAFNEGCITVADFSVDAHAVLAALRGTS